MLSSAGPTPGSLVVSLSDLYSEEQRSILMDVTMPAATVTESERPFGVLEASVRALDVNLAAFIDCKAHCRVTRVRTPPEARTTNPAVVEQIERVRAGAAMEEAQRHAKNGNLQGAREELNVVLQRLAAAPGFAASPVLQAVCRDATIAMGGLADEQTYRAAGEKRLTQAKNATTTQRAAYAEDETELEEMYSAACGQMANMNFAPAPSANGCAAPAPACAPPPQAPLNLNANVFGGGARRGEMKKAAKNF